jgi:glutaredoxin-related protein
MPRHVLDSARVHAAVQDKVAGQHAGIVQAVDQATARHAVVVVGMQGNPFCRKARRRLEAAGVAFEYLEYGSYVSQWRRRNALKMWTGWATFPMVFVRGTLIGGDEDLARLIDSGELKRLLA